MKNAMTLNELYRRCKILTDVDKLAGDMDDKEIIEILRFERDQAIEQLKSYGVELYEEADVVKVVRCKNCKYWEMFAGTNIPLGSCEKLSERDDDDDYFFDMQTGADDFCSYGERVE